MVKRITISFYDDLLKQTGYRHPQKIMQSLGISYKIAVPQSLFDCWEFFGCENIPKDIPECIQVSELSDETVTSMIGYGLSEKDVSILLDSGSNS